MGIVMSKQVIAQNGDRLDQIVYKEYKTLKVFDKVLEANPHLTAATSLKDGDIVYLPVITVPKNEYKKVKTLW